MRKNKNGERERREVRRRSKRKRGKRRQRERRERREKRRAGEGEVQRHTSFRYCEDDLIKESCCYTDLFYTNYSIRLSN